MFYQKKTQTMTQMYDPKSAC